MASNAALAALGHGVSGSVGTAISTIALYPLDLVTTRLKAQRQLDKQAHYDGLVDAFKSIASREGGASALYRGLGPDVAKSVIDSFLFFGFYNYLRRHAHGKPNVLQELALGALAGAFARAVTTPMSNAVTRKQMDPDAKTLGDVLKGIRRQNGLLGLWSGYSATLVLTTNPSITFFVNRRLARHIIPALEEEDVPIAWVAFLLAAFSKAAATALTYPFQTGKMRLQMASNSPDVKLPEARGPEPPRQARPAAKKLMDLLGKTVFGVIVAIVAKEGVRALYDGLQGELLKSFFSHGLTMLTKGVLHRLVIRLWFALNAQIRARRLRAK